MSAIYDKMMKWYDDEKIVPRPQQIEVAEKLAAGWDKKYQIVDAPTGVGKQFIALSAGYAAGTAFALTHTKQLQDQYIHGPGKCVDLRGRSNYKCGINPMMTAADAPCISFKHIIRSCTGKGICHYIRQRQAAMDADVMVTNYSYFLYSRLCGPLKSLYPGPHGEDNRRGLLIADEAHTLENHLVSFAETILDPEELKKEYDIYDMAWIFSGTEKQNIDIVESIYTTVTEKWGQQEKQIKHEYARAGLNEESANEAQIQALPEKTKKKITGLVKEHDKLDKLYKRLELYWNSKDDGDWLVHSEDGVLTLTPIKAAGLFHPFCGGSSHKYLMLSATIGCPKEFARELGLPLDECNFVTVSDSFEKERSPVVYMGVGKFNYTEIDRTLPKAMKVIDQLLNEHAGDKGIIHSTNYKVSDYIAKNSMFGGRLLHRGMNGRYNLNNHELLKLHEGSKKKSVLLSPSMNTGVSLDDDLARFQIIVKLPFASLGDPRVRKKADMPGDWYINKMWQEIMQSSGRGMRNEEDFCVTYILDESFAWFFKKFKWSLPPWFVERIII